MLDLDAKPAAADAVLSLVKLREVHGDLTREYGNFPDKPSREFLAKAAAFQAAASAAGTEISSIDERLEIQSRINFWQSARINAGQRPQTVLLAAFDREAAKRAAGNKAPYKGLAPFQKDDAKNFSGRYEIVGLLVKKVLTHRLLALVGQSGSGKSSAVRAGLIPQLADGAYDGVDDGDLTDSRTWIFPTPIVPGADPLGALEAIYGEIATPDDLPKALDSKGAPVLLSIDQFEEVFTLSEPGDRRNRFIDALLAAASAGVHRHMVVLTMRSDYQDRVKAHPAFFTAFEAGVSTIQTMQASDLRKAIEEPAARLGVGFEPGLVDKLQTSVLGEPAGLPLLSFTLLKLWEMRGDGPMKTADYEALGGDPRVILTKSADKVVGDLLPEDQLVVKEIFTRLVKINDKLDATSNRIKRAALEADLGRGDSLDRVLGILVANNLIRLSPTGAITPTTEIEVAHEALIRNWDKLAEWVREGLSKETSRRVFAVLAETWAGRDSITDKKDDLLSGLALQQAEKFEDKTPTEIAFILASKAQERRSELRRKWLTAIFLLLAVGLAVLSWTLFSNTNAEREAKGRADAFANAQALVERGELQLAKKVLLHSLRATAGLPSWVEDQIDAMYDAGGLPKWIAERFAALDGTPTLPDNFVSLLQSAQLNDPKEYSLRLVSPAEWQAAMVNRRAEADPRPIVPRGASIAGSGRRLISLWSDGSARLWRRAKNGSDWDLNPILLTLPGQTMTAITLSPDGKSAVSASMTAEQIEHAREFPLADVNLTRWSVGGTGPVKVEATATIPADYVTTIKYAPDGESLVLGTNSSVLVVDTASLGLGILSVPLSSAVQVNSAVFSDQGDNILVAHDDGWITLIDPNSEETIELAVNKKPLNTARFTPSGLRFAAGSADGVIRIFETKTRTRLYELSGHRKAVTGIAISGNGARLVSSSEDGTIRYWDLGIDSGRLLRTISVNDAAGNPIAVKSVSMSNNGTDFVAAVGDGSVRAYDSDGRMTSKVLIGTKLGTKRGDYYSEIATISADRSALLNYSVLVANGEGQGSVRFEVRDTKRSKILATWDEQHAEEISDLQISDSGSQVVYTRSIGETRKRRNRQEEIRIETRAMAPDAQAIALQKSAESPRHVAISPDGATIIIINENNVLRQFGADGKLTREIALPAIPEFLFGDYISAFSRAGVPRVAISPPGIPDTVIYDLASGKIVQTIKARGEVTALQFSPDATRLFIGTDLGSGDLYKLATDKDEVATDKYKLAKDLVVRLAGGHDSGITGAAFSAKTGKLITGSTDGTARIWNPANGRLLHVLRGHQAGVRHVSFAPDGKRALSESEDRTVRLWDTGTGQRLTSLRGHEKSANTWGWFAADGMTVQTVSDAVQAGELNTHPELRTWNVGPRPYDYADLQREACKGNGKLTMDDIERGGLGIIKPKRLDCQLVGQPQ